MVELYGQVILAWDLVRTGIEMVWFIYSYMHSYSTLHCIYYMIYYYNELIVINLRKLDRWHLM